MKKENLDAFITQLSPARMSEVDEAIAFSLGLDGE